MDYEDRAVELAERTVLTEREADVAALKEQGLTHPQIAEVLGIGKSSVDTLSGRINDRNKRAHATVEILDEILDDETIEKLLDELKNDGGQDV